MLNELVLLLARFFLNYLENQMEPLPALLASEIQHAAQSGRTNKIVTRSKKRKLAIQPKESSTPAVRVSITNDSNNSSSRDKNRQDCQSESDDEILIHQSKKP